MSCKKLESKRMKRAERDGRDPEEQRITECTFPSDGRDEVDEEKAYMNATRWMRKRDKA